MKVTGQDIGAELIQALNLRQDTCSVSIRVESDEFVEVTATHEMKDDEAKEMIRLLSKYNLTPKD